MKYYLIDKKGKISGTNNLIKWGKFMQEKNKYRIVAQTNIGKVMVSTVFLGLDHSFSDFFGKNRKPILFETMIFGSKHEDLKDYQVRYDSLKKAKEGHKDAVDFTNYLLKK